MPTFFPDGRVLAGATGGGQEPMSIDNVLYAPLAGVPVSAPRAVNDTTVLVSIGDMACLLDLPSGTRTLLGAGGNWNAAGGGHWALRRQDALPLYHDSFGRRDRPSSWRPVGASAELGILVTDYERGGLVSLRARAASEPPQVLISVGTPIPRSDVAVDGDRWAARLSDTTIRVGNRSTWGDVTVPASADLGFAGPYLVTNAAPGLILVDINLRAWALVRPGDTAFLPAVRRNGADAIITYATTLGERAGTVQVVTVVPEAHTWTPVTRPAVTVPAPPVGPCGDPRHALTPFPRPLWIAPYHSHTTRWGQNTRSEHIGNAVLLLRQSAEQTPAAAQAWAADPANHLALPVICDVDSYSAAIASQVVALYIHAASPFAAEAQYVSITRRDDVPRVPVIVYVDAPDIVPATVPALDPARVWFSPQAYRDPTEALGDFKARLERQMDVWATAGFFLVPTVQAYDRNGLVSVTHAVEALDLFPEWVRAYPICGVLPFADRRQGPVPDGRVVGGMRLHAAIRDTVRHWTRLNPEDRPARHSYHQLADRTTRLRNTLSQDRELVWLSAEDKAYLRERL